MNSPWKPHQLVGHWVPGFAGQKPGVLDELAAERAKQLEFENAELEKQAEELAIKIKNLSDVA
jgi:hypothetical protein